MPKTVNTTHVMTWNVLQGGGKRRLRILGQIAQSNATIVGLTEIRRNNLDAWIDGLTRLGYDCAPTGRFDQRLRARQCGTVSPQRIESWR